MLKIGTFGSCLSRFTASNYIKLYGGKVVTSVYHNRSDFFVNQYIDKTALPIDFELIRSFLIEESLLNENDSVIESNGCKILNNQNPEFIGQHRLENGCNFLSALDNKEVDLMIVDNYIDLSARLTTIKDYNFFFNSKDLKMGDYLSPEDSAFFIRKILSYFFFKNPSMKVAFINFPYNTYLESEDRVFRTKKFENIFNFNDILIIPSLNVHKTFQTKDKQHFKPQQYCAYAGMIKQYIGS